MESNSSASVRKRLAVVKETRDSIIKNSNNLKSLIKISLVKATVDIPGGITVGKMNLHDSEHYLSKAAELVDISFYKNKNNKYNFLRCFLLCGMLERESDRVNALTKEHDYVRSLSDLPAANYYKMRYNNLTYDKLAVAIGKIRKWVAYVSKLTPKQVIEAIINLEDMLEDSVILDLARVYKPFRKTIETDGNLVSITMNGVTIERYIVHEDIVNMLYGKDKTLVNAYLEDQSSQNVINNLGKIYSRGVVNKLNKVSITSNDFNKPNRLYKHIKTVGAIPCYKSSEEELI